MAAIGYLQGSGRIHSVIMRRHMQHIHILRAVHGAFRATHVPRHLNRHADAMATAAIQLQLPRHRRDRRHGDNVAGRNHMVQASTLQERVCNHAQREGIHQFGRVHGQGPQYVGETRMTHQNEIPPWWRQLPVHGPVTDDMQRWHICKVYGSSPGALASIYAWATDRYLLNATVCHHLRRVCAGQPNGTIMSWLSHSSDDGHGLRCSRHLYRICMHSGAISCLTGGVFHPSVPRAIRYAMTVAHAWELTTAPMPPEVLIAMASQHPHISQQDKGAVQTLCADTVRLFRIDRPTACAAIAHIMQHPDSIADVMQPFQARQQETIQFELQQQNRLWAMDANNIPQIYRFTAHMVQAAQEAIARQFQQPDGAPEAQARCRFESNLIAIQRRCTHIAFQVLQLWWQRFGVSPIAMDQHRVLVARDRGLQDFQDVIRLCVSETFPELEYCPTAPWECIEYELQDLGLPTATVAAQVSTAAAGPDRAHAIAADHNHVAGHYIDVREAWKRKDVAIPATTVTHNMARKL